MPDKEHNIWLHTYVPTGQWEIVDVTFPANNYTDYQIPYSRLAPPTPDHIEYTVLRQSTPGTVYEDRSASRASWQRGFIVLRSDTPHWTGRLLLRVLKVPQTYNAGAVTAYTPMDEGLWDDLCITPPSGINPTGPDGSMTVIAGAGAPSDTSYEGCLLADAINESCSVNFQVPHTYQMGTDIIPHIHIVRNDAVDNTGTCEFEANMRVVPLQGAASSWTGWVAGSTSLQPADGRHNSGLVYWTLANATYSFGISYQILMIVRRSGLTTGALVLTSADIHGKKGQFGSVNEGSL